METESESIKAKISDITREMNDGTLARLVERDRTSAIFRGLMAEDEDEDAPDLDPDMVPFSVYAASQRLLNEANQQISFHITGTLKARGQRNVAIVAAVCMAIGLAGLCWSFFTRMVQQ